jgi:hypothetical protein
MSNDFELFPGKSLNGLFQDIYNNQVHKKARISDLINDLKNMVRSPSDMGNLGPLINSLIDSSIRNDDHLVKLAAIATKIVAADKKTEGQEGFLSAFEKEQLLKEEVERVDDLEFEMEELKKKMK